MKGWQHIALAVVIAPLAAAPVIFLFSLSDVGLSKFPQFVVVYTPFAYAVAILGGVPIHLLLRAFRVRSPLLYLGIGGGLAALTARLLAPWGDVSGFVIVFVAGSVSATVFWVIAVGVQNERGESRA